MYLEVTNALKAIKVNIYSPFWTLTGRYRPKGMEFWTLSALARSRVDGLPWRCLSSQILSQPYKHPVIPDFQGKYQTLHLMKSTLFSRTGDRGCLLLKENTSFMPPTRRAASSQVFGSTNSLMGIEHVVGIQRQAIVQRGWNVHVLEVGTHPTLTCTSGPYVRGAALLKEMTSS